MSHEGHGISSHQHLDCLLNNLTWLTRKRTSKLHITGPLWGESISDQASYGVHIMGILEKNNHVMTGLNNNKSTEVL